MKLILHWLAVLALAAGCQHTRPASELRDEPAPGQPAGIDAQTAAQLLHTDGGFTLNEVYGNLAGSGDFAVSVYSERGERLDHVPSADEIIAFVHDRDDILSQPRNSLGGWCDGDGGGPPCYLDVSRTIQDRDLAVRLGKACNQISIAHLTTPIEFIQTGGTGAPLTGDALAACVALRDPS
jgi:hypothetical protein